MSGSPGALASAGGHSRVGRARPGGSAVGARADPAAEARTPHAGGRRRRARGVARRDRRELARAQRPDGPPSRDALGAAGPRGAQSVAAPGGGPAVRARSRRAVRRRSTELVGGASNCASRRHVRRTGASLRGEPAGKRSRQRTVSRRHLTRTSERVRAWWRSSARRSGGARGALVHPAGYLRSDADRAPAADRGREGHRVVAARHRESVARSPRARRSIRRTAWPPYAMGVRQAVAVGR